MIDIGVHLYVLESALCMQLAVCCATPQHGLCPPINRVKDIQHISSIYLNQNLHSHINSSYFHTSHSSHLLFSMHHPHMVILISVDSNISFCYFCMVCPDYTMPDIILFPELISLLVITLPV